MSYNASLSTKTIKTFLSFVVMAALASCLQNCSPVNLADPTPSSSSKAKGAARTASCSAGQGLSYSFVKDGPNNGYDYYWAPGSTGYKKLIKVQLYAYSGGGRNVQLRVSGQLRILRVVSSTIGSVTLSNPASGGPGGYNDAYWNAYLPANQIAEAVLEVMPPTAEGVEYLNLLQPCYEVWDPSLNNFTAYGDSSVMYYVIRNDNY